MEVNIRKKEKIEKTTEFAEWMKKIQEEAEAVLIKVQEEMKWQADRRKKAEVWKKKDKEMLSIKGLIFKEWLVRKLIDQYVSPYIINKVVKLWLLTSIRIYLVINTSQKILNKRKVRKIVKYLI